MVNFHDLKVGSVIEVKFNEGPVRCGVVTEMDSHSKERVLRNNRGDFHVQALFYMAEFNTYWHLAFSHDQVVFIAPEQPNFNNIINSAKEQMMRWTCTIEDESDPLTFAEITEPDDGFNLSEKEIAKLKAMQIGEEFIAGSQGQARIKRVA